MAETELASPEALEDYLDEPYHEGLIHQSVVAFRANKRQQTAGTRTRGEVAGANTKPWPQKGTGRSRHGSQKTPLWVGGGHSHGSSREKKFEKNLTRSMRRKAFRSALSERSRQDAVFTIEPPELEEPSTSTMDEWFEGLELPEPENLLLVDPEQSTLRLSVRNLPYCQPYDAGSVPTYEIVANPVVLVTEPAEQLLQERLTNA